MPLTADWVEHYFGKEAIDIADYNGDGQTEIRSIKTILGHAGCGSEIALYHWRDQKLINLTDEIKPLFGRYIEYECDDPHIWRFERVKGEAAQVLVQRVAYNSWVEGCPTYPLETRYRWNGETYQATNAVTWQDFDPTSSNSCALAWATLTMEHSPSVTQSAQAVAILTKQLAHWSATLNTIWGPAAEDYWRFKLATWQAKQGDMALAKATMQTVRDKPTHPEFKMVAHLADLFLQEYDGTADYQLACWVTIQEVARGFEAFEQEANHDNDYAWQTTQQEWGFSEPTWLNLYGSYGIANPWDMCDFELRELSIKDSITQYVHHQQPHDRAELVAALQRKGINVEASQQADLTGDGKLEDVILMTYDDVKQPQSLWAVQYADSQAQLNPISIISRITGTVSITLEQFQLSPTLTHVNLLATDNHLIIFQLNPQGGITEFFSTLIKPPYTFDPTFPPKVTFLRSNNAVVTYSWYIKEQTFLDEPPKLMAHENGFEKRPEQLKAELKRLLFDFPYQASAIDQAYLSLPLRYDSLDADLIYLIGLAYELHGDDHEAVKVYWSLWQKYPQSPFTILVRKKLAEE
jgi:hypothetical protein